MSEKFDDGGRAFPSVNSNGFGNQGMSLRDWFAGMALQGYLAAHADGTGLETREHIALWSYGCADAMLDVRSKTTPE